MNSQQQIGGAGNPHTDPELAAREWAASKGVSLTPELSIKIAELQAQEVARQTAITTADHPGMIARFNAFYPRLLESLSSAGDLIVTFLQTVIVSFGVPITLILFAIVEQQRVYHGLALFEVDPQICTFGATALVLSNIIIKFVIHYIEWVRGYQAPERTAFSFRSFGSRIRYLIGFGEWQQQRLSPAAPFHALLNTITLIVLGAALAGSMRDMIQRSSGVWYQAVITVFTGSDLKSFIAWLVGFLFAYGAVRIVQAFGEYLAERCIVILARMTEAKTTAQEVDQTALKQIAAAEIVAFTKQQLKRPRAAPIDPTLPNLVKIGELASVKPQRATPKRKKVLEHLTANPADLETGNAELAARLGVSDELVRLVKAEYSAAPVDPQPDETVTP